MSDVPDPRGARAADTHPRLRLVAFAAVIIGVVLLATAAFLLSYSGIHQIALQAGVPRRLARLYPMIFDAMLVIAGAAALALRGAGWWTRAYVWLSLLLLLGAVAAGDAVHATGIALPRQPSRAVVAVVPWALLLLGFGFWLAMLRQLRRLRVAGSAASQARQGRPEASAAGNSAASTSVTWAGRGSTPARAGAPRTGIDALLEPRAAPEPAGSHAGLAGEQADGAEAAGRSPYIVHEVYPGVLTEQESPAYSPAPPAHGGQSPIYSPEPPAYSPEPEPPAYSPQPPGNAGQPSTYEPGPSGHAEEPGPGSGLPHQRARFSYGADGREAPGSGAPGEGRPAGPDQALAGPGAPDPAHADAGDAEGPGGANVGAEDLSGAQAADPAANPAPANPAPAAPEEPSEPSAGTAGPEGAQETAGPEETQEIAGPEETHEIAATFDRMRSSPTPPHPTPSQD